MTDANPDQNAKLYQPPGKLPTILMFQPTRFEIVESDRLTEWEEHLRRDVGLDGLALVEGIKQRTVTVCLCGNPERRDDCDQLPT